MLTENRTKNKCDTILTCIFRYVRRREKNSAIRVILTIKYINHQLKSIYMEKPLSGGMYKEGF